MVKRTAVVVAAAVAVAAAGSAYGHTLLSYGTTFKDGDLCVFGSAHIQHGSAVIDSGADVMSVSNGPYLGCSGEQDSGPVLDRLAQAAVPVGDVQLGRLQ